MRSVGKDAVVSSKRRREPAYLVTAAVFAWLLLVLWLDSDLLKSLTIIGLGLNTVGIAIHGKPDWPGVGLSERLLHLLPDPLWRAGAGLMGLAVAALGAWGLTQALG